METKHTPGPWTLAEDNKQLVVTPFSVISISYVYLAKPITEKEKRANSNLIAAAPELLEALKLWQAANALGDAQMLADARIKRDIVIAKAEGKS